MSTDERVAAFLKGESLPVEVEAVEKELAALWQAAADEKEASPAPVTRACRLNLFIYSPNEGAYERVAGALSELMRRHPSRTVALIAEPEAENEELAAYISAPRRPFDNQIQEGRGEQITIAAKGNAVKNLPGIALPLRVAEIPMVLWWLNDLPEDDALFAQLLSASQRLIFDSAYSLDIGNELSRARALCLTWKNGICGDLNWLRLARGRELMTQFLESPEAAPMLGHIEKVDFEVAMAPEGDAHFAQPFLLLGWLASRLNWKLNEPLTPISASAAQNENSEPVGETAFRTSWQSSDREVVGTIKLHKPAAEADEASSPIGIMAAQIQFRQNGDAMTFELRRDPQTFVYSSEGKSGQATMRVTKGEQTLSESMVSFAEVTLAELMAQELERVIHDQVYENALRFATQLI